MVDFFGVLEKIYNGMLLVSLGELRPPQAHPTCLEGRTVAGMRLCLAESQNTLITLRTRPLELLA